MSEPTHNNSSSNSDSQDPAMNLIRARISTIYGEEPSAKEEIKEVARIHSPTSKHQKYMQQLSSSGKSLADIQTAWHSYYLGLPDNEKHEVWQEFYKNSKQAPTKPTVTHAPVSAKPSETPPHNYHSKTAAHKVPAKRSIAAIKKQVTRKAASSQKAKLSAKQHFKSLLFGVSLGATVLIVLLFGFFNERFIAPFITPSKSVSATPIIIDPTTTAVGPENKVIIPKINVEVPVNYDVATIEEKDIQHGLESGVVHYNTTSSPGEKGNTVIFGHSSNNIFNGGKYKFAFVLLSKLEVGDTFMLNKDGKRYVYRIYDKKIIKPTEVSVLGATDRPATAMLITCDPPGTSLNRLVVTGEQISPDPAANTTSTASVDQNTQPEIVPGNAPTLWSRIISWVRG